MQPFLGMSYGGSRLRLRGRMGKKVFPRQGHGVHADNQSSNPIQRSSLGAVEMEQDML